MNNSDKVLITTMGMLLENEEPDYKKIFQEYCKDKIADLGTIDIPDEIWGEEEINTWDIIMTTDGIAEFSDLRVINKEELNEEDNLIAIDKDNNIVLNTPMLTSLGYAARMEFNQIDREYYNKILEYWNDIYFDEMMEGYVDVLYSVKNNDNSKDTIKKEESKEATRQLQQNYKKTLERELDKVQKEIEDAGPGDISGLEDRRDFLVDKIDQLESDLNKKEESKSTNYEIEYVIPNYTGGNIYVYTGKLQDGIYFMASDSMYDGDYFDTWFVNEDPDKVEDDGAWYTDWQEEHKTEKQITDDKEAREFTIQLLNWIIKNKPEGNYDINDMKGMLDVIYN